MDIRRLTTDANLLGFGNFTLLFEMQGRGAKNGFAALCIGGGGMGVAM
jgi:hypothetical protein